MYASEILATIGAFTTIIITVVLYFRTRHRERLALIKYDKNASIFKSDSRLGIKLGLLMVALGFGLGVGSFIDYIFNCQPVGVFTAMMICGGFALLKYNNYFQGSSMSNFGSTTEPDEFI